MKKFSKDNSSTEQADVLCYAFSPDLLHATESDLNEFLDVLAFYFPKTEAGEGNYKPMDNPTYLNTFNSAYANVRLLIEERRLKRRHRETTLVAVSTLIILALTLGYDIFSNCITKYQQPQNATQNNKINTQP